MQSEAREAAEGRTDKVEMLVTESEIVVTQLYKLGKTPKQMIQTFDIASVVYASPVRLELQPSISPPWFTYNHLSSICLQAFIRYSAATPPLLHSRLRG